MPFILTWVSCSCHVKFNCLFSGKCMKHNSYLFCTAIIYFLAIFVEFKVLPGAVVVLGIACSYRHWPQDLCWPLQMSTSFSPATLSHTIWYYHSMPLTHLPYPLLTSANQRPRPVPMPWPCFPEKKKQEQPRRSWELLVHTVTCQVVGVALSRGSCCVAQGSTSLQAASSGPPAYMEALIKVDRCVPAHRQVTGSYLHTEAFSRAQFPPHRSCRRSPLRAVPVLQVGKSWVWRSWLQRWCPLCFSSAWQDSPGLCSPWKKGGSSAVPKGQPQAGRGSQPEEGTASLLAVMFAL